MARLATRGQATPATTGSSVNGATAVPRARKAVRATWEALARTGPGTLAGRYLRRFWQPVYVSADLPSGRAKPITVMSEQFTLYRGESGTAQVVDFRCPHRGTQLSVGWVRGDNIRCLYHGWTYAPDGRCVEQPAEPEPFCEKIRIRSYPTREYLGLIFTYLGEGEPPAFPRYPEFEEEGILRTSDLGVHDCNWFNRIDQAGDVVHVFFAHPQLNLNSAPGVRTAETEYGAIVYADYSDGSSDVMHFHMPNLNQFPVGRGPQVAWNLQWRVPVDDARYRTFGVNLVRVTGDAAQAYRAENSSWMTPWTPGQSPKELGDAILRGDLTIDEILHLPHAVLIQDYVITVGQGAIAPREMDRLGQEDVATILIRNLWARELRALADGQPTKRWTRPERLPIRIEVDESSSGGG